MMGTAPSPQTVSLKAETMGGDQGRGATSRIDPPSAPRAKAPGEDPSLYVGSTPPCPQAPGARDPRRPELDLKRYDLKRPDFEGIWLKIEA